MIPGLYDTDETTPVAIGGFALACASVCIYILAW